MARLGADRDTRNAKQLIQVSSSCPDKKYIVWKFCINCHFTRSKCRVHCSLSIPAMPLSAQEDLHVSTAGGIVVVSCHGDLLLSLPISGGGRMEKSREYKVWATRSYQQIRPTHLMPPGDSSSSSYSAGGRVTRLRRTSSVRYPI